MSVTEYLQEQKRLVADCSTYKFGMQSADRIAHVEAPKLIAAIEAVLEVISGDMAWGANGEWVTHRVIDVNDVRDAIEAALGGEGDGE